jgi:hypothetical protein
MAEISFEMLLSGAKLSFCADYAVHTKSTQIALFLQTKTVCIPIQINVCHALQ